MSTWLKIYGIYIVLMSLAALILYAADKRKAKKGQWRISEKTLLLVGLLGGAAGALIGMKVIRHKTKHWYFWCVNIIGLIWQAGAAVYLILAGRV